MVEALLEELPGQFLTYMRSREIKPQNLNTETTLPPPSTHSAPFNLVL